MLLSGALFALFMTGFWLYCLADALLTPAAECRAMRKQAWIAVIAVTFIAGAIAWLIVRQPVRNSAPATDDAVARHPAGRARVTVVTRAVPKGPDDDMEFLRALDRAIRGNSLAQGRATVLPATAIWPAQLTPE